MIVDAVKAPRVVEQSGKRQGCSRLSQEGADIFKISELEGRLEKDGDKDSMNIICYR